MAIPVLIYTSISLELSLSRKKGDRLPGGRDSACEEREQPMETAIVLVRAFSAYFQLANMSEQVHRVRGLRGRSEADGWLARVTRDVADELGPAGLSEAVDGGCMGSHAHG